ncbi:peptidylprolyl isomerase [Myxococcota bacterium]|nr:peptidylprolyl isomerase [Myxococcota bacterium]
MVTTLGEIELTLCLEDAPRTVENFLSYVNSGAYTDSGIIHRSVQQVGVENGFFIFQGGGFFIDSTTGGVPFLNTVPTEEPIEMEDALAHLRGTIAMARRSPLNSATSQWFINVENNAWSSPYAVFGSVSEESLATVDAIAALPTEAINQGLLSDTPLDGYPGGNESFFPYLVGVTDVIDLPEPSSAVQGFSALAVLVFLARYQKTGLSRGSRYG